MFGGCTGENDWTSNHPHQRQRVARVAPGVGNRVPNAKSRVARALADREDEHRGPTRDEVGAPPRQCRLARCDPQVSQHDDRDQADRHLEQQDARDIERDRRCVERERAGAARLQRVRGEHHTETEDGDRHRHSGCGDPQAWTV